jgi:hypothetical protein
MARFYGQDFAFRPFPAIVFGFGLVVLSLGLGVAKTVDKALFRTLMKFLKKFGYKLYEAVRRCLQPVPQDRPTFQELVEFLGNLETWQHSEFSLKMTGSLTPPSPELRQLTLANLVLPADFI